ncbi:hypothetical protein M8C21_023930, partial [Ambrosia artemisiifolia]
GTHTIEVINQEPYKGKVNNHFNDPTCFSKMTKLKFLKISNVHFPQGLDYLSNDLRILEWYGCSLKSLPSMFEPKHIYELDMCSSQLETLWKNDLDMPNLKSINLSFSKDLADIPNLTSAPNLVKLNLEGCTKLTMLHASVLLHKRLRYLNLKGCTCLESLGSSHMEMEALEALLLSGCSKLECIPEFGENMKHLEHLYVDGTRIKKLPENLGEMCDLRNLDVSRTCIEELPSSISRLKKLRLLHRLQSFPKLSLLDEDTDYGPRSRFNYYVSTKRVDVSKFQASSFNSCPTVSLLNCPKLAVNKRGNNLAEKLRTKYWMTPEAVFKIVGAGTEIPAGFVQPDNKGLFHEGPWIGVAIFAVISVNNIDGCTETKYTVTAHIHLGDKHSKFPVCINFLEADSKTQLVFYWTVVDDLRRIVVSSQKINIIVSFSVEPEDNNLQRQESMIRVGNGMIHIANLNRECFESRIEACIDYTYMDHRIHKILDLVFDKERRQICSLNSIYQITKGLLEISEEYFAHLNANSTGNYSYYVISLGASALYNDFVQSVKEINDGWLSVKLALEQIVVKSRADNCSYKEMLQHINDLEADKSVGFSDKFIKLLELIFIRTFDVVHDFNMVLHDKYKFKPENSYFVLKGKVFAKLPVIVTCVLCTLAAYMGDCELLEAMKQSNMNSLLLHLLQSFTARKRMKDGYFIIKTHSNCELQISDFCDNRILLQELMNKMGRSTCFTKENAEEMVSVINKLQNNIAMVSSTIQEISSHADQYSNDLAKVKKHVKFFTKLSKDDNIISMLPLLTEN